MTAHAADSYVTDVAYLRDFKPALAPAWLDHVALVCGIAPPPRDAGFAWCDLGCGQGVTAAVLAATHPHGVFHGIDLMPAHVAHASALAAEAGIGNAFFHGADFAAAAALGLPQFDYIVAHGVYTWIEPPQQRALRHFIDAQLRPGGLVYVSYNAMPGWAADLPAQFLLRAFAAHFPGDSAARAVLAAQRLRSLTAARAPALAPSYIAAELQRNPGNYPAAYLAHEFLHAGWQPLYVTEMRAAMAEIGLAPVGSAFLAENFDDLLLGEEALAIVAGIADADLRELVRDFFIDQRFRADVFTRGGRKLDPEERIARLAASGFALARPPGAVGYAMTTPKGRVDCDGPQARAVVAALAAGPRRLAEIGVELLPAVLKLCAAGDVVPAEPEPASVAALHRAIRRRLGGPDEIGWLPLPCGTAIEVHRDLLRAACDGTLDEEKFPGWPGFLAAHGI